MKIVFMGTPDFAKESLEAIYNAKYEIVGVVTNPDKPKGRGMKMVASPVKEFATEKHLIIYQPLKVKNNTEFIKQIESLKPDVICVVAYGKILPKELLEIPKYGSINVHGSLLPKYRGAAPIQWAILNGDKETGITTMFMDEGMDTGDMILQEKVQIRENETTGELWKELSKVGAKLLVQTLEKVNEANNEIENDNEIGKILNNEQKSNKLYNEKIKKLVGARKQPADFTTAPMLNKEISQIDWNKSATEIHNLVRGLNPIMGATTTLNGKKIKIWKTEIVKDEILNTSNNCKSGEIVLADKKKGLFVKTKEGIISIIEIQEENSKKMDIKNFLNGNNIEKNLILK